MSSLSARQPEKDSQTIYLDYAAATPMDRRVEIAMRPYARELYYNPSASYNAANLIRGTIDDSRREVAHWLGVRSSEIVFTAGGSEANNMAIHGVMSQYAGANIVVSAIEHESVLAAARRYDCRIVEVDKDGRLDLDDLFAKIDNKTCLISIMFANNEIGTIQPIHEIGRMVENIRHIRKSNLPLYLHSDACQAANYLDLHVSRLGLDLMTLNGGKIYGPKQSGALFVSASAKLRPLIDGGGQEFGLRSGTENVGAIIGFAKALDLVQSDRHFENHRLKLLQHEFIKSLIKISPKISVNGSEKYRLPNNVHISIKGIDNERMLIELDEAGVMVAAGSACSASDEEPSHVLRAIGLSDEEARSSLRITLGRQTTKAELNQFQKIIANLIAT